jgi:hypothetical protein
MQRQHCLLNVLNVLHVLNEFWNLMDARWSRWSWTSAYTTRATTPTFPRPTFCGRARTNLPTWRGGPSGETSNSKSHSTHSTHSTHTTHSTNTDDTDIHSSGTSSSHQMSGAHPDNQYMGPVPQYAVVPLFHSLARGGTDSAANRLMMLLNRINVSPPRACIGHSATCAEVRRSGGDRSVARTSQAGGQSTDEPLYRYGACGHDRMQMREVAGTQGYGRPRTGSYTLRL